MIDWLLLGTGALVLAFWVIVFVLLCRAFGVLVTDLVGIWRRRK